MAGPDELTEFVQASLEKKIPRPQIVEVLARAGWESDQVERALGRFADVEFPLPVPRPRPYLSAREAFLYLVMFATLYTSALALGGLLFSFVDRAFPDAANPLSDERFRDSVRWSVANLLVAFPVFAALAVSTQRAIARDPARRASRVRKWLTYLTLFLGASILIGDVVALLNAVLKGELPTRFMLKVLVVGGIAGTAFGYYLRQLRRDEAREEPT
ncbi:MAG: DUF5671 domain-containing protein [Candidatus Eisenbacteria bacterium]